MLAKMSIFILLYFGVVVDSQESFDFNNFNENSNIDNFNPDMNYKPSEDFFAQMMAMAAEKLGDKFQGNAAWNTRNVTNQLIQILKNQKK